MKLLWQESNKRVKVSVCIFGRMNMDIGVNIIATTPHTLILVFFFRRRSIFQMKYQTWRCGYLPFTVINFTYQQIEFWIGRGHKGLLWWQQKTLDFVTYYFSVLSLFFLFFQYFFWFWIKFVHSVYKTNGSVRFSEMNNFN